MQRAGALINHSKLTSQNGIKYSGYGIVLKVDKYNSIHYNPDELSRHLHLEGMTDYLTAIELGLYEWFGLISDHSKTSRVPVEYGDHTFVMDSDVAPEDIKDQLLKTIKAPVNVRYIRLPDGIKDLSDFVQKGGTLADFLELIGDPDDYLMPLKAEDRDQRTLLSLDQIRSKIHNENDRPIDDRVVEMILKHYDIICTLSGRSHQFFIYKNGYYHQIYQEEIQAMIYDWILPEKRSANLFDRIIKLLKSKPGIFVEPEKLNSQKSLINIDNCCYNFERNIAMPHSKKYYFTFKNNFSYNPTSACPEFDKALWEYSMHDPLWIDLFWEIAGYVQLGDMPIQKMFWFVGAKGRNGKGTLIRILENLVGNVFTAPDLKIKELNEKFYLNRLRNKRLATAGDLPPRLVNVSTIKQLTGADQIVSDVKYGDPVTFTNNAKFVFAMNQIPLLPKGERKEPILKRLVILPFEYVIKEPDTNIEQKFMQEMSGIFNKSMGGLKRIQSNKKFTELLRAKPYIDQFANREEMHETFFNLHLEPAKDAGAFLYMIWDKYCRWMDQQHAGDTWKFDRSIAVRNTRNLSNALMEYYQAKGIGISKSEKHCSTKGGKYTFFHGLDIKSEYEEKDMF